MTGIKKNQSVPPSAELPAVKEIAEKIEKKAAEGFIPDYMIFNDPHQSLIFVRAALNDYNNKGQDKRIKDPTVYLQDNKLVQLVKDENEDLSLVEIDRGKLALILTSPGSWGKREGDEFKPCKIPKDLLEQILSAGATWLGDAVPSIKKIHTGVLLTKDWRILHKSGYDLKSRIYLTTDYTLPELPEIPTEDDIKKVKSLFWDMLGDFKYEDQTGEDSVDYQNTIAALCTAAIRPVWKGPLPIWTVSKSNAGAGGSLLQETVCRLANGSADLPETYPDTDHELQTRIETLIKNRAVFGFIDNVPPGRIWSLPILLTYCSGQGGASIRIFRSQDQIHRDAETFFAVNGVNLEISADVCRRILPVRIVPIKPWQQIGSEFKRTKEELQSAAEKYHPDIIWGIAVLHKYWINKGSPAPFSCTGNISEYGEWYKEICGPLNAAGYTHVLENLAAAQTLNNEADITDASLLKGLVTLFNTDAFKPQDLADAANREGRKQKDGVNAELLLLPYIPQKYVDKAVMQQLSAEYAGYILKPLLDKAVPGSDYRLRKIKNVKGISYRIENVQKTLIPSADP